MFAVIYQGVIKAGMEETYKNAWHEVAVRQAIITIQNCIDHEFNQKNQIRFETCMEVVDDLLYAKKAKVAASKL